MLNEGKHFHMGLMLGYVVTFTGNALLETGTLDAIIIQSF